MSDGQSADRAHDSPGGRTSPPLLPWSHRANSMPYLRGGFENQARELRELLVALDESDGYDASPLTVAEGGWQTVGEIVLALPRCGLIESDGVHRHILSDAAKRWLETNDNLYLLDALHANVRFVGEMLETLRSGPKSSAALLQIAQQEYSLQWKTKDQVRRRIAWLKALGVVEEMPSHTFGLTPYGLEVLDGLPLESAIPQKNDGPFDLSSVTIPTPPEPIREVLESLTDDLLRSRRQHIGYIPRKGGELDAVGALTQLINICSPSIARADLFEYCKKMGMADSSLGATLTTLTTTHLLEEVALGIFAPTREAAAWLESGEAIDLVRILHSRVLFILEIVPMLSEHDRAPDLARAGVTSFGLGRADPGDVRTRLQILKAAGLVEEYTSFRFRPTARGLVLAAETLLQHPCDVDETDIGVTSARKEPTTGTATHDLAAELIVAGVDADHPERLEKLVARAFGEMGFDAQHIGGGGQTDVLLGVRTSAGMARIIVDAKTSRSGSVTEQVISFDTLIEHRTKHGAEQVAVVAPGFSGSRLHQRAINHRVRLITTEELADALHRYDSCPISPVDLLGFFEPEDDKRQMLDRRWLSVERRIRLWTAVVNVLAREADDSDAVTGGALTADQVYLLLRDELDPRPTTENIGYVLDLLAHPFIGAVAPSGNGKPTAYVLVDQPRTTGRKLGALEAALRQLASEEG